MAFAVFALCYLASPVFIHLFNGFSPPMFTFTLLASAVAFFVALQEPSRPRALVVWALAMLGSGLTRPEGNFFNALLICAYIWCHRQGALVAIRRLLFTIGGTYVVPGLAYFLWRTQYFGLTWPLPFYVKGLYPGSRLDAVIGNMQGLAPHLGVALGILALTLAISVEGRPSETRVRSAVCVSALLLLASYMVMNMSQNLTYRFQYPAYVVLLLLSCWRLGDLLKTAKKRTAPTYVAVVVAATLWFTGSSIPIPQQADETVSIGRSLEKFAKRGYAMATTEAGRLPFHSKWRTLDSYGLNDPDIALGTFDRIHWDLYSPQLVMIHPAAGWNIYEMPFPADNHGNRRTLMEFMRKSGTYDLVAVVHRLRRTGEVRGDDYNLYFVSRTCPDYREIRHALLNADGAHYARVPEGIPKFLSGA